MNMELCLGNTILAGDPRLVDHIVGEVKSQGIFDQFRKECIADVDTKPAYQNLRTRVESSVNSFLGKQTWKADLNKNQLRETLRKHIHDAPYLDAGVERIVDQVVNPKVYSVFMPQIEDVVYKFLGLERPKSRRRNGPCGFKDLLPVDLDPVSPESDKNSLKDVSLDSVDARIDEPAESKSKDTATASNPEPARGDEDIEKNLPRNGHDDEDAASQDASAKTPSVSQQPANSSLNNSSRSDDKNEEEEEDSPTFEPIDIMNLNDSQISNDSHLSGISELTSHRSRSPDFSNDGSRDNMDFSCHDSEFSKVSSDSRLSIVTDFGSSNHDSAQLSESHRDERDKNDGKYAKDNFKAVREFESGKSSRAASESSVVKETTGGDGKSIRRSISSKETSRDGMEASSKEKIKDNDASKARPTKERGVEKDSKKDRDKESSKKQTNNHGDAKSDKCTKPKSKEKSDGSRGSSEKTRDKDATTKPKEDKLKETDKKESVNAPKEVKDLKDIYKEKIRELREKKELLREKKKDCEKIGKDNKDAKTTKDNRDKRDSSREKKDTGKDHSKNAREKSSSRTDGKSSKVTEKDGKIKGDGKGDSKDKGKRDERRYSREHKSRSSSGQSDDKRGSRSERDEKIDKSETKQKSLVKKDSSIKNSDNKRDSRGEIEAKDKKRRDEKKAKTKDDHSSMRKNTDDRRSTDRDGSNGSNGKNSQKSSSGSSATTAKPVSSSLSKESTNTSSNSSSETSDNVEESQNEKLRTSIDERQSERDSTIGDSESSTKRLDLAQGEISLPLKKRPLTGDDNAKIEITMKKPKFAKNFQEAKKLMKIRRKIEKEKIRQRLEMENNRKIESIESRSNSPVERTKRAASNDIQSVPDEERVQIIEVRDEEYDEPYPEIRSDFTMEERSQIILGGGESMIFSSEPTSALRSKSTLSEMEMSIRESLNEMINDKRIDESCQVPKNSTRHVEPETARCENETSCTGDENPTSSKFTEEDATEKDLSSSKDSTVRNEGEMVKLTVIAEGVVENETKIIEKEGRVINETDEEIVCKLENVEGTDEMKITEAVEDNVAQREDKLSHETIKNEEKLEIPEIEEKVTAEMMNKEDKAAEPEAPQIVETPESFDSAKIEEKPPLEIVEKATIIESPESERKSIPEIVENEENIEITESQEKSPLEINKQEDNIETSKSEQKSIMDIVEKQEEGEGSESEEKLKLVIVDKEDNLAGLDSGEKSLPESIDEQEKLETPETIEQPSKIVEEQKNIDISESENQLAPKVTEEKEKSASPTSEDKSSSLVKKHKKRESSELEETLASEVAKKQKKVESPKSEVITKEETVTVESSTPKTSSIDTLAAAPLDRETTTESCNKDDEPSIETVDETAVRDAARESDDDEPCRYFTVNNERLERFEKFLKSLEADELSGDEVTSDEFVDASASNDEIVSSVSKTMAPPKPKRKYSTSPLTDIMLNNTNNNNDADKKITATISVVDEDNPNTVKKRKIGRPRKQKSNPTLCSQQNLLNGENFVMPLSPESDVSATSEKTPSNSIKDEKSRPRGSNQRYTSDDLYKPRPLFASSSRRSRRSNPA